MSRHSLFRFDKSEVDVHWDDDSPASGSFDTERGRITVRHGVMLSGKSAGVEVCTIDTGAATAYLLPTRGMGIWRITAGDTEFGWRSPVDGPVHPSLVPISDPDGLGWLEGFDELLVRCGLESNGAPQHAPDGRLTYPLHGRIANTPARVTAIHCDPTAGTIELVGEAVESKLFFKRLRLRSSCIFTAGSAAIEIVDTVTNELETPVTAQMLYHINIGSPVLEAGARVVAPIRTLAPKDERAGSEIEHWDRIGTPEPGYTERVYFSQLHADTEGRSAAMLRGADGSRGLGVTIDTRTLPYFILWKNTAAESDGYVVGLEPATNFPNGRDAESQQGRVVSLDPGAGVRFSLGLHPLTDADAVSGFQQRISDLSSDRAAEIRSEPDSAWSV